MTIEYDLYLDDMVALASYHSEHSAAEKRRRLLTQAFFVIVFILLLGSALTGIRNTEIEWTPLSVGISFLPLLCPATLVFLVFSPAVRRWGSRRSVHKAFSDVKPGEVIAHQRLSMTADALDVDSGVADMRLNKDDIVQVSKTDTHAFILTNFGQAVIVPRRAFPSPEAFGAFVDSVKSYGGL